MIETTSTSIWRLAFFAMNPYEVTPVDTKMYIHFHKYFVKHQVSQFHSTSPDLEFELPKKKFQQNLDLNFWRDLMGGSLLEWNRLKIWSIVA